jgi:predicted deacylase
MKQEIIENERYRLISYDSGRKGLTFCITGGVHGDEMCGVHSIYKLEDWFAKGNRLLHGKLLTLIANVKAVKLKSRFVDSDLNRAFGNPRCDGHELRLAQEISPHLTKVDYLLDLHSTSAPTHPFCAGILTENHYKTFLKTGIDVYTHGWEVHRGYAMLIDEVNRFGGVGIIAECGKTKDSQTNKVAYETTFRLLKSLGMISFSDSFHIHEKHIVLRINEIVTAKTSSFKFTRIFKNLELIEADEIIAHDGKKPLKFPYSFNIMMPTLGIIQPGDEVFGIGIIERS